MARRGADWNGSAGKKRRTTMRLSEMCEMVREFHLKFGCPVGDPDNPRIDQHELRVSLVCEELDELEEAMRTGDVPGTADALADLLYVVLGTVVVFQGRWFDGANVFPDGMIDPFLIPPKRSLKVEIRNPSGILTKLGSEVDAFVGAVMDDNVCLACLHLQHLAVRVTRESRILGIDLGPVFEEVHRANMAKVGGPTRADGKILKPEGWTPPDVAGVLRRQGWSGETIRSLNRAVRGSADPDDIIGCLREPGSNKTWR